MRVFSNLLIILNLLILLSPQFLLANENLKSNRIIQEQEVLNACSQTILRSVEISLQEMGKEKLAIRLSKLNFPAKFQGKTLAEISKLLELKVLLLLKKSSPSIDSEALKKAFHRSNSFLRLDNRYLEKHTKYKSNLRSKRINIHLFRNIDNFNSQVSVVEWHGVNQYVNSRLGPLKSLISTLKPDDNVILTNTSYEPILLQIDDAISIYQYNLPLSSYGKNIRIIHRRGGKKTLILSDFDSKAYLIHFGLLINSYRKKNNLQFKIYDHIDQTCLKKSCNQLSEFASFHKSVFNSLNAIVIGYASEFSEQWSRFNIRNIEQNGYSGENWKLSVYKFPEGKTVGVLGGDVDYYGESLLGQLDQLLANIQIPIVFFGGSGGALIPRAPYDLYFPSTIHSNEGIDTHNILCSSDDAGIHVSVDSPLLETPYRLSRFQSRNIYTIDMEGGHLAKLASKYGTKIGLAILVTDFPIRFQSINVSLGKQNFGKKKSSRNLFVQRVEAYIRKNEKTFLHKIERDSGLSIHEISKMNLEHLRKETGLLSADELKLVSRLRSCPLRVYIRMTPGRLHWMLIDKALFSTGLMNSLGEKTKPYTPKLEDKLYGAFDYVFARYSSDYGQRRYGDVIVILKADKILPRTWGTTISGWRAAQRSKSGSIRDARNKFIAEIFHSDHYQEAMELLAVIRFRKFSPQKQKRLLTESSKSFNNSYTEFGLRYLELKIKSFVLSSEVERVMLPPKARGEIPTNLKKLGIPFEYYNPRRYPKNIDQQTCTTLK